MKLAQVRSIVLVFFVLSLFSFSSGFAAPVDSVGVEKINGTQYIRHKVEAGENWYSISRRYAIFYTELRLANKESAEVLKVGQIINIPPKAKLNDPRYIKNEMDKAPVKETPKVEKAVEVNPTPKPTVPEKQVASTTVNKTVKHVVAPGQTVYSISRIYGVKPSDISEWNNLKNYSISVGQELIIKDATKTETSGERIVPEVTTPKVTIEKSPEPAKVDPSEKTISGYVFASGRQEVTEKGFAGFIEEEEINPNKYYALHRTAPIGTVIKVTNKKNDRSVFVKVVGSLPNTPENDGFILKMSKAGADQLWVYDKKFQVELLYGVPAK